jgi:hypothetical protein
MPKCQRAEKADEGSASQQKTRARRNGRMHSNECIPTEQNEQNGTPGYHKLEQEK